MYIVELAPLFHEQSHISISPYADGIEFLYVNQKSYYPMPLEGFTSADSIDFSFFLLLDYQGDLEDGSSFRLELPTSPLPVTSRVI